MLIAPAIMAPLLWPRWGIVLAFVMSTVVISLLAWRK
jgi:hypothetical protein